MVARGLGVVGLLSSSALASTRSERLLVGLGLFVVTTLGCGQTSQSRSGPPSNVAGNGAAAGVAGGGVSNGGSEQGGAGRGGIGGSGGQPTNIGGVSIGGSDCRGWPPGCEVTCDAPIAGCLLNAEGEVPTENLQLELQVVSVQTVPEAENMVYCSGPGGLIGGSLGDVARFVLQDTQGATWALLFPAALVPSDRFAIAQTLQVEQKTSGLAVFFRHYLLTVREAGEVAAFVFDGSNMPFAIEGLDLQIVDGDLACPWSLPFGGTTCSDAVFHTVAKSGDQTVDDPCGTPIGGLVVSSLSSAFSVSRPQCGGTPGFCDGTGRHLASGVRLK